MPTYTPKTWIDLRTYLQAEEGEQDEFIQQCWDDSKDLVAKYVGENSIPANILDRAYLEVGADLFNRRSAPNGVVNQQFATADGIGTTGIRISRDPMAAAYKLLGRWVLPW